MYVCINNNIYISSSYIYIYMYLCTYTYNQRCMGFMYILGYDWDINWDKLSLS